MHSTQEYTINVGEATELLEDTRINRNVEGGAELAVEKAKVHAILALAAALRILAER